MNRTRTIESFVCIAVLVAVLFVGVWQIKPAQATTGSFGDTNKETNEMGSDTKFACRFQAPASGTVTDMSFYTEDVGSDENGIDLAVYSDNANAPDAPLGYATTPDVGGLGWYNATGLSVTIVSGTYYWLAACQSAEGYTYRCKYHDGAVNQTATGAAGKPPSNPFGTPTYYDREISIYANYTTSGGDTTAPTYSNVGTNTTLANQPCNFTAILADETALANYTFGTNNTGVWTNESKVDISGVSFKTNTTKTLNSTLGTVVQWEYWFADSSNNLNNTGLQSLTTSANYNLTINSIPVSVNYSINGTNVGFTVNASSGSSVDVQTAINTVLSAGGGTVYIPAGSWGWNQTSEGNITINLASLQAGAWLNIIGAGGQVNTTTRTGDYRLMPTTIINSTGDVFYGAFFTVTGAANKHIRFSGIAFLGNVSDPLSLSDPMYVTHGIRLERVDTFRIDNCFFDSFTGSAIQAWASKGLIDHCVIDDTFAQHVSGHPPNEVPWGYGVQVAGDCQFGNTWMPLSSILGQWDTGYTYQAGPVYIENCNFSMCRHAIVGQQAGFYCARYNAFLTGRSSGMAYIDIHGWSGSSGSGGRGIEIYNNTVSGCIGMFVRGGGGVIYDNTYISCSDAIELTNDDFDGNYSYYEFIHDLWIWNNSFPSCYQTLVNEYNQTRPNIDYFSDIPTVGSYPWPATETEPPRPSYVSYTYPHPFTETSGTSGFTNSTEALDEGVYEVTVPSQVISGNYTYNFVEWQDSSTNTTLTIDLTANTTITATYTDVTVVTVSIMSPTNTTYPSSSISVSLSASGGIIDKIWWNCKNGTSWIYGSNQTYTVPTSMTGFVDGASYTFYAWANNTLGEWDEETVMFTVLIIVVPYDWGSWWGDWWGIP